MQIDIHPQQPSNDLMQLESEELELRLADLIRRYVRHRSQDLARDVVRHIDALCLNCDGDVAFGSRCDYLRSARHWRWLAQSRPVPGRGGKGPAAMPLATAAGRPSASHTL